MVSESVELAWGRVGGEEIGLAAELGSPTVQHVTAAYEQRVEGTLREAISDLDPAA